MNKEISDLKANAESINLEFDTEKSSGLTDRLLELENDKVSVSADISGEDDAQKKNELKKELKKIEEEILFIQQNTTETAREEARAYDELFESQKLILELEKERTSELEKNKQQTDALIEKRNLLELQSGQNGINDRKIQIREEEGLLVGFYENKKGELTKIQDFENILLAEEIVNKQNYFAQETNLLTEQLANQYKEQADAKKEIQELYKTHYAILEEETATSSAKMLQSLVSVESKLKRIIALRAQAGLSSSSSSSSSGVSGARANG